jgi:hypothetical protein
MRYALLLLALFLPPIVAAPHAHAATQACKEGVKATVEGEIRHKPRSVILEYFLKR